MDTMMTIRAPHSGARFEVDLLGAIALREAKGAATYEELLAAVRAGEALRRVPEVAS